jgi:hypothetical protein
MCYRISKQIKQVILAMPRDFEEAPSEAAKKRAERRWRNYDVGKRFKEAKNKPSIVPSATPKDLEIGATIENKKPDRRGSVIRARTKFARDIKVMMEGHAKRNLILYALSIRAQRKRLFLEKLRRLEARQAQRQPQEG